MATGTASSDTRAGSFDWESRSWVRFVLPGLAAERRKRAEPALTTVVATYYLLGVSTRICDLSPGDPQPDFATSTSEQTRDANDD